MTDQVLDDATWRVRRAAHEARMDAYLAPHQARRRAGVPHPVYDFLFTYYSHKPSQLRRWHPGYGLRLPESAAAEYLAFRGYADGAVTDEYVITQQGLIAALGHLLGATAARAGNFACFGMHEWAMVYRLGPEDVRHPRWPLRLGPAGTDAVVESQRITCSHFDAFRFFTPPARPLNVQQPGREDRADHEQPACLHAGMDLYKHAFRLSPMISSDLVADCFELAWDIRILDMRAAPYDLAGLGFEPVRIETPDGRQEYAAAQRAFAERGAGLRAGLIEECERLLVVGDQQRSARLTEVGDAEPVHPGQAGPGQAGPGQLPLQRAQ
ncbi:MAG: 3-methyladenine DNA glycosylase [Nocardioides sp.]